MSKALPFKIETSDPLSFWRAETFWTKEVETIAWLDYFSGRAEILVDVGSNIGIYSMYWMALNIDSRTIACEPFEENQKLFNANILLNDFKSRTTLISSPLSKNGGLGYFEVSDFRPGASGYSFRQPQGSLPNGVSPIESQTLDQIAVGEFAKLILKIDVDGLDFELLQGATKLLKSKRLLSILIESEQSLHSEITKFLSKFGYSPDLRFDELEFHSDQRRALNGQIEQNRVYTYA